MKYNSFDELPVWQSGITLAVRVFDWCALGTLRGHSGLRDQLERAVLSISNNIAEGFERGTHDELIAFLYYARGSVGEVRSMLVFLYKANEWADRRSEIVEMGKLSLSVMNQLGSWLRSLQNSPYAGPKHDNDATRHARQMADRQSAFLDKLKRYQEGYRDETLPTPDEDDQTPRTLL